MGALVLVSTHRHLGRALVYATSKQSRQTRVRSGYCFYTLTLQRMGYVAIAVEGVEPTRTLLMRQVALPSASPQRILVLDRTSWGVTQPQPSDNPNDHLRYCTLTQHPLEFRTCVPHPELLSSRPTGLYASLCYQQTVPPQVILNRRTGAVDGESLELPAFTFRV